MLNVGGLIDSAVRCNNNKTPDILAMRCCVTPCYWVNYSHSITVQRINILLTQSCQYICNDDILRSSFYPLKQHLHRLHNGARTKCGALTTVCHWKKHHDASNVISDDICVGPSNNQMRHNSALTTVIKKEVYLFTTFIPVREKPVKTE